MTSAYVRIERRPSGACIILPPGNYLASYIMRLEQSGESISQEVLESLRRQYGLDLNLWQRYTKWMWNLLHGDLGRCFEWNRPVSDLLADRLPLTIIISVITLVFAYCIAIPVGIYSGLRQYSAGDYLFTALGFFGLTIPNFLLALALMLSWSAQSSGIVRQAVFVLSMRVAGCTSGLSYMAWRSTGIRRRGRSDIPKTPASDTPFAFLQRGIPTSSGLCFRWTGTCSVLRSRAVYSFLAPTSLAGTCFSARFTLLGSRSP